MYPYKPPSEEGSDPTDWKLSNKNAKAVLHCTPLWDALKSFLPNSDQLVITVAGETLQNPWQEFLQLVRHLCLQLLPQSKLP